MMKKCIRDLRDPWYFEVSWYRHSFLLLLLATYLLYLGSVLLIPRVYHFSE